MATGGETVALSALSVLGALAQAAVTLRWYEPPPRDGETPTAVLEAGVFFLVFAVLFGLLGSVLSTVAGLAPPYTSVGIVVLTPLGLWLAYMAYTDQVSTMDDDAERFMGVVAGVVAGAFPIVLLAV